MSLQITSCTINAGGLSATCVTSGDPGPTPASSSGAGFFMNDSTLGNVNPSASASYSGNLAIDLSTAYSGLFFGDAPCLSWSLGYNNIFGMDPSNLDASNLPLPVALDASLQIKPTSFTATANGDGTYHLTWATDAKFGQSNPPAFFTADTVNLYVDGVLNTNLGAFSAGSATSPNLGIGAHTLTITVVRSENSGSGESYPSAGVNVSTSRKWSYNDPAIAHYSILIDQGTYVTSPVNFPDAIYIGVMEFYHTGTDLSIGYHRGGTSSTLMVDIDGGGFNDMGTGVTFGTDGTANIFTGQPRATRRITVLYGPNGGGILKTGAVSSTDGAASLSRPAKAQTCIAIGTQTLALPGDHQIADTGISYAQAVPGSWSRGLNLENSTVRNVGLRFTISGATSLSALYSAGFNVYHGVFVDGVFQATRQSSTSWWVESGPLVDTLTTGSHLIEMFWGGAGTNVNYAFQALMTGGTGITISAPPGYTGKFVGLGDSITQQITNGTSFVYRISSALKHEPFNLGVAGSTVADASSNYSSNPFIGRVSQIPSDANDVLIIGGYNDELHGVTQANFVRSYLALLAAIRTQAPTAKVWVAHILPTSAQDVSVFNGYIDSLFATWGDANSQLIDLGTGLTVNGTNYADGTHLLDPGEAIVTSNFLALNITPIQPGTASFVSATSTSLTFSWTASTAGDGSPTTTPQYKLSSSGTWINGTGPSPETIGSLSAATSYDFRVQYTDTTGTVYSNTVTHTTSTTTLSGVNPVLLNIPSNGGGNNTQVSVQAQDLTGASVEMILYAADNVRKRIFSVPGTITNPTANQTLTFNVPIVGLQFGDPGYIFTVRAQIPNVGPRVLATGQIFLSAT